MAIVERLYANEKCRDLCRRYCRDLSLIAVGRVHIEVRAMTLRSFGAIMQRRCKRMAIILICCVATLAGCTVYEPVPAPAPSTFERSWSAALGAAQDEGVRIASEDRVDGVIRGFRADQEVTINIRTQADGNVRVEMSSRGPKGSDPGLTARLSRAYDRRMGR
jgi:hypothetical protein